MHLCDYNNKFILNVSKNFVFVFVFLLGGEGGGTAGEGEQVERSRLLVASQSCFNKDLLIYFIIKGFAKVKEVIGLGK